MAYKLIAEAEATNLNYFRSLRGKSGHLSEGIFIAEGPKIVPLVLKSKFEIVCGFMTAHWLNNLEKAIEVYPSALPLTIASKEQMESVVGYALHQGVMLAVRIPPSPKLAELLSVPKGDHTFVALDSIADAENMGTIIRTCAAFGVTGLIVDEQSCHPFLRRSVRVSMGTILDIPIVRIPSLRNALLELKLAGSKVFAATLGLSSVSLQTSDLSGDITLVFGSEGKGITKGILDVCDREITIPIAAGIDSLNVGVANGIVLYERFRSRNG